ncbi:MAG: TetR/AcrR family transcriptional regulator [Methyloceanibacter sp.]|nr:TetR/AcrR family transcriptional regulator [Methyloceanibacter sp.]
MLKRRIESGSRFHREAWLSAALNVLAEEGQAKLRVDKLAADLGVTKGSFYHHFKSRDDFVQKLLDYWSRNYTDRVIKEIGALKATPQERILEMMRLIVRERLDRYDIAFRSWAAQEPSVAELLRKVDARRHVFCRSLFAEMGFEGEELEFRTHAFLAYQVGKGTIFLPQALRGNPERVRWAETFFANPSLPADERLPTEIASSA